mmetsp:Transcript_5168/g.16306  ORF Transcript_5168/g.16306 Transcript_5168/m.16306 type:complete len:215 (+) Transcript_5168:386-1030(+)
MPPRVSAFALIVAARALRVVVPRRAVGAAAATAWLPRDAFAKCADIETCRELGEAKVEAKEAANPTIKLADGVRFKRLRDGAGATVAAGDVVDVAYSISSAGGAYMYSRGFGFEKDADGVLDTGDFLRVKLGSQDVPKGIEAALLGMRVSEKRRVELPSGPVGFESSSWRPAPQTRRGKAQITAYRRVLEGNGSSQPPFPAATIWDVEVRRVRR